MPHDPTQSQCKECIPSDLDLFFQCQAGLSQLTGLIRTKNQHDSTEDTVHAWLHVCVCPLKSQGSFWIVPCFSRMRSEGFPFIVGGLGVGAVFAWRASCRRLSSSLVVCRRLSSSVVVCRRLSSSSRLKFAAIGGSFCK